VSITTVYGGVSISRQIARVRHADVVVATPGRSLLTDDGKFASAPGHRAESHHCPD
jgi:superfamily II DNA/RNA helicase